MVLPTLVRGGLVSLNYHSALPFFRVYAGIYDYISISFLLPSCWVQSYSPGTIKNFISTVDKDLAMSAIESGHLETVSDVVSPIDILSDPVVSETLDGSDGRHYGAHICGWMGGASGHVIVT